MSIAARPKVILVAGMLRSGSTWLYNAARLALADSDSTLTASWIEDYDPAAPGDVHLVKAHNPRHVRFTPDVILTTWRPFEACIASLVRMGWRQTSPEDLRQAYQRQTYLYRYWRVRTDLEIDYADIIQSPQTAIAQLMRQLDLTSSADRLHQIAAALDHLQGPAAGGHDQATLLHPGHRSDPHQDIPITATEVLDRLGSILPE